MSIISHSVALTLSVPAIMSQQICEILDDISDKLQSMETFLSFCLNLLLILSPQGVSRYKEMTL